jgi:hypothetical protein
VASKSLTFDIFGRDRSATTALRGVARQTDLLGKAFWRLGGIIVSAFALHRVIDFSQKTIASLGRIESISAQTGAAIKSTGGAAGVTREHIIELAGSLERLTATEAESIQQGANLLLTFKNIRNSAGEGNDIFDQATTALVDMARAMGQDPASAAIQLGKALNDPIKGIAALSRVGITFTKDQENMIRALSEAGDVMAAQKIILAELNSQFGGSGAAFAATYAGSVALVGHAWGTVAETLLAGVVPALTTVFTAGATALDALNDSAGFQALVDKLSAFAESKAETIADTFGIIATAATTGDYKPLEDLFNTMASEVPALALVKTIFDTLAPLAPVLADGLLEIGKVLTSEGVIDSLAQLVKELLPPLVELLIAIAPLIPPIAAFLTTVLVPALQLAAGNISMVTLLVDALKGDLSPEGFIAAAEGLPILGAAFKFLGDVIFNTMRGIAGVLNSFITAVESAINGVRSLTGMAGTLHLPRFQVTDPRAQAGFGTGLGGGGGRAAVALAMGGVIRATPGGTFAQIGEAGTDEAVIPLTDEVLGKIGHSIGQTGGSKVEIHAHGVDPQTVTQMIYQRMRSRLAVGV